MRCHGLGVCSDCRAWHRRRRMSTQIEVRATDIRHRQSFAQFARLMLLHSRICKTAGVRQTWVSPIGVTGRFRSAVGNISGVREERNFVMKRLIVPALALGLAIAFATPASAGLWDHDGGKGNCCEPCKPKCPKPVCKPKCKPASEKSCDPCHKGCLGCKLKGWCGLGHKKSCDPCNGGAAPAAPASQAPAKSAAEFGPGPRLQPIPSNTAANLRTSRRLLN